MPAQSLFVRSMRVDGVSPDVVYVVRSGDKNEELRYSLRSLSNLPHGRVWIAGHKPRWVSDEVGHIAAPQFAFGHTQAKANLRAACEHPEVSERFVYMNDDFYVMQPMDELPVMHRGLLSEVIASTVMSGAYNRAMRKTLELLHKRGIAEPLMYDLHAPMLVTKTGMLEALAACSSQMHERTVFGNLEAIGGERRRNHKMRRSDKGWESWEFLSTNDRIFASLPVGEYIRSRFPAMSRYEATPPAVTPVVPVRPLRRPVRHRAPGVAA